MEYERLPSYYNEFGSDEEMQKLPHQLYDTFRRVQVRSAELGIMLLTHGADTCSPFSFFLAQIRGGSHCKPNPFTKALDDIMIACQALVVAGLDIDLNSRTVKDLVLGAMQTAEKHHRSLVALHGLTAGLRSFEDSWQQMVHLLEVAERSKSGREDVNGGAIGKAILSGATIRQNLESELARALLALWLYFDLECADSADHVRRTSRLLLRRP